MHSSISDKASFLKNIHIEGSSDKQEIAIPAKDYLIKWFCLGGFE